jgi:hypothetical protein
MDAYAQSNQQGFRMYQPKPINPIIQYVSEKVAAPVEQTSDEAIIERAKLTGKPAHAQAYEDYAKNQAQIDFLRQQSEENAARALGFQSPEVDRIYGEIATNQANAPEPPSMMTPQAPNIAQRGMAVLASLINPRLGLTLQNQPMLVNEQLAKEQDQRNVADYTRADTRFSKMMTALNTRLGIAQRDETAQRNTAASIANRQQSEATRLSGQSGTMLSKLIASIDNEAKRLSNEAIANQKIDFETDKATKRLKYDETKLKAWIQDRSAQLAETIRYHTGVLDAKDVEIAQAQARIEAANLMDKYKIQWGESANRRENEAANRKDAATADSVARTLRKEANERLMKLTGSANAIQVKIAEFQNSIERITKMIPQEQDAKKRQEMELDLAEAKQMLQVYGSQLADAQDAMARANQEATGPQVNIGPAQGGPFGSTATDAGVQPGGAAPFGSGNVGSPITVDGQDFVINGTPDKPGHNSRQYPNGAGPVQPGKTLPPVGGKGGSKRSVGARGGNIGYTVVKPGGK